MIQARGKDDILKIIKTLVITESCQSMTEFSNTEIIDKAFYPKTTSYGLDLSYTSKIEFLWIYFPEDFLKEFDLFVTEHKSYCRSINGDFGLIDFRIMCIKCGDQLNHEYLKIVPVSDQVDEADFRAAMVDFKILEKEKDRQHRAVMRKHEEDRKQTEIEVKNNEYLGYIIGGFFVIIIFIFSS